MTKFRILLILFLLSCNPSVNTRSDYMQVWREDGIIMLNVTVPETWFRVFVNGAFLIENYCGIYDDFCSCEQAINPDQLPSGQLKFELVSNGIHETDVL